LAQLSRQPVRRAHQPESRARKCFACPAPISGLPGAIAGPASTPLSCDGEVGPLGMESLF